MFKLFKYTKDKFDDGSEEGIFYAHPLLAILILIGAVMGIITAIEVIIEAFV